MTQSGWRKPTPGLGIAEQFAQAGEQVAVPKSRAFVAMKRVGAHVGLKAGDMLLLDTLGAFTSKKLSRRNGIAITFRHLLTIHD